MERDFGWLWENLKEGARQKFEDICYDVYSSEFSNADVHKVAVTQGDGGIDIYIEEENSTYTIIQCKYFLNRLNDNRKNQIRESFKTASTKNEMDNWILCIPMDLSYEEHNWWKTWKKRQNDLDITIKLHDGSKLMKLIKKQGLYEEYFNTVRIDQDFIKEAANTGEKAKIHERLYKLISTISTLDCDLFEIVCAVDTLGDLKAHKFFKGNDLLFYLDQLSILYSYHAEGPNSYGKRLKDPLLIEQEIDLRRKIIDEYSRLDFD
ncbi:hypothetical protein ETH99_09815 [Macrococcoides caseolyticum]|uniref:restriction endonuclease n=1 Tax=Macrococcoides caseolyticum TaxID=69966 RepID=UPI00105BD2CD|nr:restriction endonuclease [Macrococcus caseolyticus]TDM25433.1 hypothetical protein ETH99_09815 [Macrococcus caseolyticus]